jgi:hypothetical protein
MYKTDSDTSFFLSRSLEQLLPEVVKKRYPQLNFSNGSWLPTIEDLNTGAMNVIKQVTSEYGEAELEGDTDTIPLAEVSLGEDRAKVLVAVAGFGYSQRELDAVAMAESKMLQYTNLTSERMMRSRRMIEEKMHRTLAFGDLRRNSVGFLNSTLVPRINSSFNPYTSTNQQDIIDWVSAPITDVRTDSELVESPNLILMPEELFRKCATTFRSTNSDTTVLDAIYKANPTIASIQSYQEGQSAMLERYGVVPAATNKDRMVVYNLEPENLSVRSSGLQIMPSQVKGMRWETPMYKCFTEVMWNYPLTARYIDFPKAL